MQAIMQQNACTKTKYFRMTKTVSNPLIFSSPLILERLGLFIYTLYSVCPPFSLLPFPCMCQSIVGMALFHKQV